MYKIKKPNEFRTSAENPLEGTDIFIDPNTLSDDGTASLESMAWSDDGNYMAYQIKLKGSDWATIKVRSGETL